MGFWDVLFFLPTALIVAELSTRFPSEGGLYIWAKEAFGEFHGFITGWTYWVYTFFYFPGLLFASAAMAAYVGGERTAHLAQERTFLLVVSILMLGAAVWLNIIGLNIGKWLQNAGGVGTYVPLLMLIALGAYLWHLHGSMTQFTTRNIMPVWNWDTVNFWPQIAFAFTALELCSTMSEEVRDPHKTFPRAILGSGVLIAVAYILGTFALLAIIPAEAVDPKSGVFQALTTGSISLGIAFFGIIAAFLVLFGNAGGVGTTVAGVARIPFVVGIDRYMPAAFGKIHSKWKTPWVSILVQAGISAVVLLLAQVNETANSAYQILVDAAVILYLIPFLYMYAAVINLAYRADRGANPNAALVPGGKFGMWLAGILGTIVVTAGIVLSLIPPGGAESPWRFEGKVVVGTVGSFLLGVFLYMRGARAKAREAAEHVAAD